MAEKSKAELQSDPYSVAKCCRESGEPLIIKDDDGDMVFMTYEYYKAWRADFERLDLRAALFEGELDFYEGRSYTQEEVSKSLLETINETAEAAA